MKEVLNKGVGNRERYYMGRVLHVERLLHETKKE